MEIRIGHICYDEIIKEMNKSYTEVDELGHGNLEIIGNFIPVPYSDAIKFIFEMDSSNGTAFMNFQENKLRGWIYIGQNSARSCFCISEPKCRLSIISFKETSIYSYVISNIP